MSILDRIRNLFRKKEPAPVPEEAPVSPSKTRKICKGCGKTFTVDPSWDHIPNYCRDCKKRFVQEKEEKQRAGAPRKIRRKCRSCGKFFTFPSTLAHYPNYCNDCRKRHQAEMKAKYSGKGKKEGQ